MARGRRPTGDTLQFDDQLGRGLRRARLDAGIGFREAARLAELDISSIYRIEHGQIQPTFETLQTLLRLYVVNLNMGPDGLMLTWMKADGGTQ